MVFHSQKLSVEQRKHRNRLKSRYSRQAAIGSALFLISLFLIPSVGGFAELGRQYGRMSYTQTALAGIKVLKSSFYTQTGTTVAFGLWDVAYEFELDGQVYKGLGQLDYDPQFVKTMMVYYHPDSPASNSIDGPSYQRFLLVLVLLLAPLLASLLLLFLAYRNYRLYQSSMQ